VVVVAEADGGWLWSALALLWVPLLIVVNGLFVAAEYSLVAVRKTRIEELVHQGRKGARAAAAALDNLDRTIAAVQLGVTLASIALGWIGEPALAGLLGPLFESLPSPWGHAALHSVAVVLAFVLITFMHVVFGEQIPKSLALQVPDETALWLARPLGVFIRLTRPFTLLMAGTSNLILRSCGFRKSTGEEAVHSVEELLLLIEDTEEAGILEPEQAEFVENVFKLSEKRVGDLMVSRDKMAALELTMPQDKVLEAVRSGAHTRMPVYEGNLDNIVGIVNTKDLFYLFSLEKAVVLYDALYPPLFLGPDEDLGDALELFKRTHRPMALVRDENEKILGLITLEDIVEEIVGDIEDEHDVPNPKLLRWRRRLRRKPPEKPPGRAAGS
jgi:CBS domain containing-hemolysin-like protein